MTPTPPQRAEALSDERIEALALDCGIQRCEFEEADLRGFLPRFARAIEAEVWKSQEAEARDSARYRWLRDEAEWTTAMDHSERTAHYEAIVPLVYRDNPRRLQGLDAAIDAAISAGKGE